MRHYLYLIFSYTDLDFSPTTRSCMNVLSFHVTIYSPILCNKSYQPHIWLHCIGDFFDAQFMLSTKTLRVYGQFIYCVDDNSHFQIQHWMLMQIRFYCCKTKDKFRNKREAREKEKTREKDAYKNAQGICAGVLDY